MTRMRRGANVALLREIVGERFHDARNLVLHALQRANDWKALYGPATLAESYARGDCDVHLHLRFKKLPSGGIKNVDTALAGLVRWYVSNPADLSIRAQRHRAVEVSSSGEASEFQGCRSRSENRDEAVLVGIVQLLQKKEGALPTSVPSLVWLKPLNDSLVLTGNSVDHTPAISKFIPLEMGDERPFVPSSVSLGLADQEDRELGIEGRPFSVGPDELIDKPVESRAQIVRDLSDQQRPINWEVLRAALHSETEIGGLRIVLGYADFVEVVPEEPLNALLESCDLVPCPLDSSPWPIARMHDEYSGRGHSQWTLADA